MCIHTDCKFQLDIRNCVMKQLGFGSVRLICHINEILNNVRGKNMLQEDIKIQTDTKERATQSVSNSLHLKKIIEQTNRLTKTEFHLKISIQRQVDK